MRPMARLYAKKAASRSAAVKMTQGGLYFLAESANLLLQKREEGLKIDSESERLKTCGGGLRSPSYRAMENHIQRKGMNKMNQTQTRSPRKRLLSLILAVILMIGLLPISAFATSASAQAGEDKAATQDSEFLRIFHLDCGRKYFTVGQIKDLIDTASANNYTHVELAVGNNGLRFLLKDMSLEVDGKTYTSDDVTTAIEAGNKQYSNSKNTTDSALSETDMDTIIAYARGKNIRIIPLINTPGHMNAILSAAKSLTRTTCAYNGSGTTIDVTNTTAVAFTQALLKKYVSYFAGKGCEYFNMGADEYANDIYTSGSMGFGQLQSSGQYRDYVTYVNQVAKLIDDAGMTPMAFNDGIYYKSNEFGGTFDSNIVVCYWTSGFNNGDGGRYDPAPASFLVSKGHKVINTQDAWYYVLGRSNGTYGLSSAKKGANNTRVTSVPGGGATPIGCMQCLWCDEPSASYSNTEVSNVKGLMQTLSSNNPTYFAEVAPLGPSIKPESGTSLTVGSNGTVLTISGVTDGSTVTWTVDNLSVIKLLAAGNDDGDSITGTRVTAVPVGEGTATVTATVDGKACTIELTVTDPNTEHVYVTVGETSKIFTQSGDVTGNVVETDYNRSVASYTAKYVHTDASQKKTLGSKVTMNSDGTYTGVISDGTNYLVIDSSGNISSTTEIADATEFTVVRNTTTGWFGTTTYYTIQGNGRYLTVNQTGNGWDGYTYTLETTFQSEDWSYSTSYGFSTSSRYLTYSNGWTVARNSGTGFLYSVKDESTQAKDETQITFTGVSVGETSVTIGGTKYVIHVQDKAPDDAMTTGTITLEYWITNFPVYESNNTSSSKSATISKTDSRVLTDDGLAVAELAPEHAYSNFDGWKDVYYWQTMRLDKDNQQTMADKDDETSDGTTLTHIRYRNDAWQYKTAGGLWRYFLSTDQLVAYYLQKTEVTKEVTTYVKDWGYKTDSVTPNKDTDESNNYKGQVALTVAVVYPDGTVSPAEGDMYASSTTIFNYWSGRDIGIVAPVNNSDYNISKITVTDGTRSSTASHDTYDTWLSTDTITWGKKAQADGETQWYNETEVWNKSSGTTPMVNGKASNITWSAKNTAKLVLIYLEPIERETNLNVVYWDDNAKSQIYQYQIAMKYTQGGAVPSFITDLKTGDGDVIGGIPSWPGKTPADEGYLPDDAYVTNSSDVNQNISKELGTGMAGISGVYTSGLYEYVSADISTDGKTLTLHYNLKKTDAKTFVVDFGLPLKIPASAFGITDTSTIETVSFEYNKVVHEKDGQYGHGSIDQENGLVTYTLTKMLDSRVAIPLWVTFTNDSKPAQMLSVNIIPASNVYYEDSLASFADGKGVAENAKWSTVGNDDKVPTEQTDVYQALEELGKHSNVYGHDGAYNSSSMLSMGTAHKVTVTAAMLEAYNGGNKDNFAWPTAQFTFKGTGFDIISLTDNTSGAIMVTVEGVTDTTYKKNFLVNNYYGYAYDKDKNEWVTVASGDSNAIYQIPVMKVNGIPYGEYKVTIGVLYNSLFDKTGNSAYSFWLDAVRIYDPMGEYTGYTQDNEGYPQYIKLHDEVVSNDVTVTNALFIDGEKNATIQQYTNLGPNNEVYLMKGQAITFKLTGDTGKIASVQIGAKAPKGTVELKVNDSVVVEKLSTATEMYYDITTQATGDNNYQVTITNTTGNILSLTNLKITYSEKGSVSLGTLNTQEQESAVSLVRALFTAPVATFSPETFEADWGRAVRAGKRATLTVKTSADVESITVDGQSITGYTTRTQRTGWGWWSPKVTYHVFTYTITAPAQTTDYAVCAVNAEGTASEAVTATLTVKPTTWWNWWF